MAKRKNRPKRKIGISHNKNCPYCNRKVDRAIVSKRGDRVIVKHLFWPVNCIKSGREILGNDRY